MRSIASGNIRKILVRSTNWIGDAVMTTPALGALRSAFPDAEIVLAANPVVSELMTPHPSCDRVIVYDKKGAHKGVRGLFRFSAGLRCERFDMALLLQNAIEAAIIARLARIKIRAGYSTDGRGLLLTHSVPVAREALTFHHTEYYLNLLKGLGIPGTGQKLHLFCTDEEKRRARLTLGDGNWAAINPGAAFGSAKRWYPERFAQVADVLADKYGFKILLLGGKGEAEIGAQIESKTVSSPLNLIGKTSVREMMALISEMKLFVTNDSGPMHVAAAFDRPVVALFAPTDHTTTSPVCSNFRIVRHDTECAPCLKRQCPEDHRCMDAISAEDVAAAVSDLIK
jgi:heptosyltransferase II